MREGRKEDLQSRMGKLRKSLPLEISTEVGTNPRGGGERNLPGTLLLLHSREGSTSDKCSQNIPQDSSPCTAPAAVKNGFGSAA